MKIAIARALPGKRKAKKCVKPTAKLKKAKRCTRYVTVGVLTRKGAAGANRAAFSGRIKQRKLAPGRYRATLVAADAGGLKSAPARVGFRVLRP